MGIDTIVKVGGSLFTLPDLATRLQQWLLAEASGGKGVLLVPGGGAMADVVRALDRCHGLGEESSHWLALRAVALNAVFLAALLPSTRVIADLAEVSRAWLGGRVPVLDVHAFAVADEIRDASLPHTWAVTSDALAARVAVVARARRLILLKSATIPEEMPWREASRLGLVDALFAEVLEHVPPELEVRSVNLRTWQSRDE